ncbi:MAG: TraB/GumN family protein [Methanospirillum sp.]|uniref:TraB/GumN family protein n=1 Tax=Methanospirillum sp. TaxID=45200 RepID=UPI0023743D27|nr:TraB/GumN family protein [Methanospirillum sp.]MDD1728967.1 TraB/GumN family protein [Methanospirillum sp.]
MGEIRIIGTAHVSQQSVDEVVAAIGDWNPDVVAIELDQGRYNGMKQQQQNPDIEEILQAKNFNQLLIQWVLAYIQRKIGMDVGVEPGAEMKAAIAEAEERGIELALIDRDIRVTLHRFWASMSILEKLKMFYALAGSLVVAEDVSEKIDIEELKKEDFVTVAMEEFHKFSPRGAYALISERDAYMSYHLLNLGQTHERVLAVVGAGHRKGIDGFLADPKTLPPMAGLVESIKTRPWGKIFAAAVMIVFALIIIAIIFSGVGTDVLLLALMYWVIIHGIPTMVCTLLAGGHPLSAITGFLISPISALHPLIAAGWFSAIVEAKIRKPRPSDVKKIFTAESFTEMRKIPLFKVVLVAALANVGSSIGTFAYFIFIFPILGIDPSILLSTGFENMIHAITSLFT